MINSQSDDSVYKLAVSFKRTVLNLLCVFFIDSIVRSI
jgi:hypothetical protein